VYIFEVPCNDWLRYRRVDFCSLSLNMFRKKNELLEQEHTEIFLFFSSPRILDVSLGRCRSHRLGHENIRLRARPLLRTACLTFMCCFVVCWRLYDDPSNNSVLFVFLLTGSPCECVWVCPCVLAPSQWKKKKNTLKIEDNEDVNKKRKIYPLLVYLK
jgi:hypothetical protein